MAGRPRNIKCHRRSPAAVHHFENYQIIALILLRKPPSFLICVYHVHRGTEGDAVNDWTIRLER